MKVLVAASTFPRAPGDRLPDFVWQQVRWMSRVQPGLRLFVLAPHDRGAALRERWENVDIRRFRYFFPGALQRLVYPAIWPNLRRAPWLMLQVPFLLITEFLAALRWIRQERFDVVYSHWFMPQAVACGLAAMLTGTPHVFTSHSSDVAVMRKVPILGPWLVRLLVRRARAITAVSTRSRDIIAGFFRASEWKELSPKVAVIPMGVDVAEWSAIPDESEPDHLLFVGRLAEKKGVEYLLDALATVAAREPARDLRLTIAGDGPLADSLQARARSLGIADRVQFRGFVTGDERTDCFRRARVVVLPSIVTGAGDAEGMPVVLLEALAAGRICIATDASGATDVVRGGGGDAIIVPQKDAAALAAAIGRALDMPDDERRAMARRARETAAAYAWQSVARAHVRHLLPGA